MVVKKNKYNKLILNDLCIFSETLNQYVANKYNVQYEAKLEVEYFNIDDKCTGLDFNIILDQEQFDNPLDDDRLLSCALYKDDLVKIRDKINEFLLIKE